MVLLSQILIRKKKSLRKKISEGLAFLIVALPKILMHQSTFALLGFTLVFCVYWGMGGGAGGELKWPLKTLWQVVVSVSAASLWEGKFLYESSDWSISVCKMISQRSNKNHCSVLKYYLQNWGILKIICWYLTVSLESSADHETVKNLVSFDFMETVGFGCMYFYCSMSLGLFKY